MLFHEMSHIFQLFSEKLLKTSKHDGLLEMSQVLAKWMIFHAFSRNEPFFGTFFRKFIKTSKHDGLLKKLQVLAKSMIFHAFSRNQPLFATFFRKVHENLET